MELMATNQKGSESRNRAHSTTWFLFYPFSFFFSWPGNQANYYFHDAMGVSLRCVNTLTCCALLLCSAMLTTFLLGDCCPWNNHFKGRLGGSFTNSVVITPWLSKGTKTYNRKEDSGEGWAEGSQLSRLPPILLPAFLMIFIQHPCGLAHQSHRNWNPSQNFRAEWARVRWGEWMDRYCRWQGERKA